MSEDRIAFTRGAAQRIAKAVRIVEAGDKDADPINFGVRLQEFSSRFPLRLATFTGNWQTGEYKTVTLHGSTNTASVYNWCNPAVGGDTASSTESRYVIFGRVQGTQSAVEIQMRTTQCTASLTVGGVDLESLPGYDSGVIQLLGHGQQDTAATCSVGLQWYSITTCATATAS